MRRFRLWVQFLLPVVLGATALNCGDSTGPQPNIALSAEDLSFDATAGEPSPDALTVSITNSGGGTLRELTATVTPSTATWLSATLSATTAPATLMLRVTTSILPAGTYVATVSVASSASNGPQTVTVTLTVTLPPLVSPKNLTATAVSPTQIDLAWTDNAAMEDGFQVWRCAGAGCTDVVRVTSLGANTTSYADEGLNPSTSYSYRVRAYRASEVSDYSNTATAATPAAPAISLSSAAATFTAGAGGADPDQQTVSVTNSGGGTLSGLSGQTTYTAGQPIGWLSSVLTGTTAPATLILMPSPGKLPAGTYNATLAIASPVAANSPQTVSVTFTVLALPAAPSNLAATAVSPTQIDLAWTDNASNEDGFFIERCMGALCTDFTLYGDAGPNVTSLHNPGLESATSYRYRVRAFNAGGRSAYSNAVTTSTLARLDATAIGEGAVTSDPPGINCGLGGTQCLFDFPGGAVVTLSATAAAGWQFLGWSGACSGSGACQVAMSQNRDVAAGFGELPRIALDAPSVTFSITAGAGNPAAQTVGVTNGGGGTLDQLAVGSIAYEAGEPGEWLAATLDQTTAPATVTLQATTGVLAAGTYTALVPIGSPVAANSPQHVPVTFNVAAAPAIVVSPAAVTFNDAVTGGPDPGAQTVAVTNGGTGTLGSLAVGTIAYGGAQPTGWLAAVLDHATAPATLTLQATIGSLVAGSYSATVSVTSPEALNSPQTVSVVLTVTAALAPDLTVTGFPAPLSVTPNSVGAGSTTTISSRIVRNVGTAPSGPFDVEYYLSTDPVVTSADTRLTGHTHTGLVAGGFTTYPATGLTIPVATPPGVYYVGVLVDGPGAVGESNEENNYAKTSLTVLPPVPAVPSNLVASPASSSAITLTWTDNSSNETGFVIERCTPDVLVFCAGSGSSYGWIGAVGANVTTFQSTGLLSAKTYYYRVRAVNGLSASSPSNSAAAATQAAGTPAAPSNLGATAVSASQINLTWTDNAANEEGFRVERCTGAVCTAFTEIAAVGPGVASYQSAGGENTTYRYRVRAHNAAGLSGYSGAATATTFTVAVLPAAPSGLGATALSATRVRLSWTDNATTETGFRIERCDLGIIPGVGGGACASTEFVEVALVEANATSYEDGGGIGSHTFAYRMRAYNSVGNSAFSGEAQVTLRPLPAAPTALVATALSDALIRLTWVDHATTETGFEIERCTGAPCSGAFRLERTVGANVTTLTDDRLSQGTPYSYRVRAVNADGNSAYSNTATVTTHPILAPSVVTATAVSGAQINLTWVDNATNEVGYRIETCVGSGCVIYNQIASLGPNATSYQHMNLVAGTVYSYRVRAYTLQNTSSYGAATATTPPLVAPAGLTATAVSASQINLSWADNVSGESGFKIERCAGVGCTSFVQFATLNANNTTFSNTGLASATSYSYRVRAYTASANSPYSNTATATTP